MCNCIDSFSKATLTRPSVFPCQSVCQKLTYCNIYLCLTLFQWRLGHWDTDTYLWDTRSRRCRRHSPYEFKYNRRVATTTTTTTTQSNKQRQLLDMPSALPSPLYTALLGCLVCVATTRKSFNFSTHCRTHKIKKK